MHARNDFGIRLLAELLPDTADRNVFVSPPSVLLALSMALNGARGPTREAMTGALGFAGLENDEVNRLNATLLASLDTDDPDIELDVANALWVRSGIPLAREFVHACAEHYRGRAEELDFDAEHAVATVNEWVRNRTRNRIPSIVEHLGREDVLLLTNAVYFKARWAGPFAPEETREQKFRPAAGPPRLTPMMRRTGEFDYREDDELQVIRLPYGRGNFAMYVLLSAETGVDALVAKVADGGIGPELTGLTRQPGRLVLPRFRVESGGRLNDTLGRLGMAIAFDPRRADFQAMLPAEIDMEFFISEVVHKSFIEVGEEGTEAAAATGVRMSMTSMPAEEEGFVMVCDRPFLALIRNEATGTILLIGAVNDPTR